MTIANTFVNKGIRDIFLNFKYRYTTAVSIIVEEITILVTGMVTLAKNTAR
jgi:hypothetical protein